MSARDIVGAIAVITSVGLVDKTGKQVPLSARQVASCFVLIGVCSWACGVTMAAILMGMVMQ